MTGCCCCESEVVSTWARSSPGRWPATGCGWEESPFQAADVRPSATSLLVVSRTRREEENKPWKQDLFVFMNHFFNCIHDKLKLKLQIFLNRSYCNNYIVLLKDIKLHLQLNIAACETNGQARKAKRRVKEAQGCRRADRTLIQLPNAGDSWALCSPEADKVTQEEKFIPKNWNLTAHFFSL